MKFKCFTFNPFTLLTFSLVLVLIISQLIQDGMFMDGSLYVSVSHNLSQGIGTFWEPNYSKTNMVVFREQPPLYFGLMSVFFKIFGSSMYVERFFCFCCLIAELFLIVCLWRSILKDHNGDKQSWLPVLFFIITPIVFWSYANLVEETVMVVFATMAVLFSRYALLEQRKMKQIFFIVLAAFAIVLSTLTKGIQGSFPLVAVFIFGFFERKISLKRSFLLSILLLACFIGIYLIMFFIDKNIYLNLKLYLENRLSKAFITGDHNTTDSYFYLFFRLLSELAPIIVLLFLMMLFVRKVHSKLKINLRDKPIAVSLILIGLSGTIPLMLTKEQRGFYLLTALPFFAIATAIFVFPFVSVVLKNWNTKSKSFLFFRITTLVLCVGSVFFTYLQFDKSKRDKELLHDVYMFLPNIPYGSIVGLSSDLSNTWNLRNYLIRYKYISMNYKDGEPKYKIITKNSNNKALQHHYKRVKLETKLLDLYIKN